MDEFPIVVLAVILFSIAAYVGAIELIVYAAKQKGHKSITWKLWFIGIFMTPIMIWLIVIALPDKS